MVILTHPDNVEAIRKSTTAPTIHLISAPSMYAMYAGHKIVACEYMDPTRPSGMYSINGRGRVHREHIKLVTPFVTYGPEDFDYLVYAGVVQEIQDVNILVMYDEQFDFMSSPRPNLMFTGGSPKIQPEKFTSPWHDKISFKCRY